MRIPHDRGVRRGDGDKLVNRRGDAAAVVGDQHRVGHLDRRVEEAAADLGSSRAKTLWFIVLPQLLPAILAGGLMSYAFCFDNLVVAAFLTTPSVNTLPVYLYGSLQYGPSPAVYAAASAVFVFTLLMLGIAGLIYRSSRRSPRAGLL